MTNGSSLYDELCDLERRAGVLREQARLAGLRELCDVLNVAHAALNNCVAHVVPVPQTQDQ